MNCGLTDKIAAEEAKLCFIRGRIESLSISVEHGSYDRSIGSMNAINMLANEEKKILHTLETYKALAAPPEAPPPEALDASSEVVPSDARELVVSYGTGELIIKKNDVIEYLDYLNELLDGLNAYLDTSCRVS